MKWFDTYVSNTLGGSGNQVCFGTENGRVQTGRIYYKVFSGGKYNYSLLFSNIIDSTYKDGEECNCNFICGEWEIIEAAVGICKEVSMVKAGEVESFIPLTFAGSRKKKVMPGEFFTSDPVEIDACKDDYLCYQVTYRGDVIPYHLESMLPIFVEENGEWIPDKRVPVPGMVGCDRKVKARIGYFGDSITQGIGPAPNSYAHWNALVSEAIGDEYSYWNLGLGYGRGQDAASNGAWMYKAKKMDGVVVTYGTNDIGRKRSLEQIKTDLTTVVEKLKEAGIKVFLQSLPPFSWKDDYLDKWKKVNAFVVEELSQKADGFLDVAPFLVDETEWEGKSKYEPHPNEEGCRIWAEKLIPLMKEFVQKL